VWIIVVKTGACSFPHQDAPTLATWKTHRLKVAVCLIRSYMNIRCSHYPHPKDLKRIECVVGKWLHFFHVPICATTVCHIPLYQHTMRQVVSPGFWSPKLHISSVIVANLANAWRIWSWSHLIPQICQIWRKTVEDYGRLWKLLMGIWWIYYEYECPLVLKKHKAQIHSPSLDQMPTLLVKFCILARAWKKTTKANYKCGMWGRETLRSVLRM
jgi:hypothetical protein